MQQDLLEQLVQLAQQDIQEQIAQLVLVVIVLLVGSVYKLAQSTSLAL